jgi:transposase
LWFGAPEFEVLAVFDDGVELTVEVQTVAAPVGCPGCGVRARSKDRRWVMLRDAPTGDRGVLVRWRKRVFACPERDCPTRTWTEQAPLAEPRRVLTARAVAWATDRVTAIGATPASIARVFGVSWSTVWAAIARQAAARVVAPAELAAPAMIGFDETVMCPARRRRRRRLVTAAVDLVTGRILDIFDGREAADLRAWLARLPASWLAGIEVVSVDPHEGYRGAVVRPNPHTGQASPLGHATVVVDPFHVVRLANQAVTRARQRVQQETLERRGWKGDPLYDIRKLLLGAERVDEAGWARIHAALRAGDPRRRGDRHLGRQGKVRAVYLTDDPDQAAGRLDDAIAWCTAPEATAEQTRLAKTLRRWRDEILAHHTTGASNGPVEAANLTIKQIKRSGRRVPQLRQLPAPHPAHRPTTLRETRHEHPTPPTPGWSRRAPFDRDARCYRPARRSPGRNGPRSRRPNRCLPS